MDRRTTAIVVTSLAVIACGCPGLVTLFTGLFFAVISPMPGAQIDIMGSTDPAAALSIAFVMICLGLIGIIIPVLTAIVLLRRRPEPQPVNYNEPLPPAS
jgi:hypothetical protein